MKKNLPNLSNLNRSISNSHPYFSKVKSSILLLITITTLLANVVNAAPKVNLLAPTSRKIVLPIIYVKANATGTNNGDSWTNAFTNLQTAITAAAAGVQIWVAAGTYQPASGQSFSMKEEVKIYGGFIGTETALVQRNWKFNVAKLQSNGSSVIRNNNNGLTTAALIDGFTITGGNARGENSNGINPLPTDGNGGGMYNNNVSPSIYNCLFLANEAIGGNGEIGARGNGGGMYNTNASPLVVNCVFSGNKAIGGNGNFNAGGNGNGGAIFNENSSAVFVNVVIYNNFSKGGLTEVFDEVTGVGFGGAASTDYGSPKFINIVAYGNSSGLTHLNSATLIANSIISGNTANNLVFSGNTHTVTYSYVQGGFTGTGNISAGTLFVNAADPVGADHIWGTADDGLRLQTGSSAVNAGNNNELLSGITSDFVGNDRIQDTKVDMGAYEQTPSTLPVSLVSFIAKAENNSVKLQWQTQSESNNHEFILYRMVEGQVFTKLCTVKAVGESKVAQNYTFFDRFPLSGNNYYRLVQVDNDGKTTELGIKQVAFNLQEKALFLYPNPAKDKVYFNGNANGIYRIYDSIGKQVGSGNASLLINGLDVSVLQPGVYYVQVDGKRYKLLKL